MLRQQEAVTRCERLDGRGGVAALAVAFDIALPRKQVWAAPGEDIVHLAMLLCWGAMARLWIDGPLSPDACFSGARRVWHRHRPPASSPQHRSDSAASRKGASLLRTLRTPSSASREF